VNNIKKNIFRTLVLMSLGLVSSQSFAAIKDAPFEQCFGDSTSEGNILKPCVGGLPSDPTPLPEPIPTPTPTPTPIPTPDPEPLPPEALVVTQSECIDAGYATCDDMPVDERSAMGLELLLDNYNDSANTDYGSGTGSGNSTAAQYTYDQGIGSECDKMFETGSFEWKRCMETHSPDPTPTPTPTPFDPPTDGEIDDPIYSVPDVVFDRPDLAIGGNNRVTGAGNPGGGKNYSGSIACDKRVDTGSWVGWCESNLNLKSGNY
jgi:hypothetical protein